MERLHLLACLLIATTSASLTAPALAATFVAAGAPITDFTVTTSTVTVTDSFAVQGVTLGLENIFHSYAPDVELFLDHGGLSVQLFSHQGQPYGHMTGTLGFDDAAPAAITSYFAGGGVWRPLQALSLFTGVDAQGDWTLRAYDGAGGDGGGYSAWTLNLAAPDVPAGAPEPASWALLIAGFTMVGAGLRNRRRDPDLAHAAL